MILKTRLISGWSLPATLAFIGLALVALTDARSESDPKLVKLAGSPAADLAILRVWTCSSYELESAVGVSADGRWLSYASPDTGELMVRDLVRRKTQYVVKVPPAETWHRMAYGSLVSPDGSQIAYAWRNKDKPIQFRAIRRDGKQDRLLYENKDVSWLSPACWLADSSKVVAVIPNEKASPPVKQISLFSIRDSSVQVLKSLPIDNPDPEGCCMDPGGRFLAYDTQPGAASPEHEIRVFSIQSGEETVALGGPADHRCLGWSPDGEKLLFASNRRSATDCWVQRMKNGKPQGEPQLLKQNLGKVTSLGITRKGGLCYVVNGTSTEVQVARLDLTSGECLSEPKTITGKDRGHDSDPCWSPDGKQLAYISEKDDVQVLRVRSTETGEERNYCPNIGRIYTPQWSGDGKSILLGALPRNEKHRRVRVDLSTGEVKRINENEIIPAAFTNQTFTFRREREKKQIVAKSRATGEEKILYQGAESESVGGMQIAPDGEQVAIMSNFEEGGVWKRAVKLVSVNGGDPRELIGGTNYLAGFAWFPDNRHLLCSGDKETWVLSTDGQPPRKLKACFEGYNLSINPDGRQVAFVKWDFRFELWMMQNAVSSSGRATNSKVPP
jgi:Tol biopolymer transport system component